MEILEVNNVSIRYMTGDFKEIGLKEFVVRKLKGNYHVNEFWADKNISFTLEKGDMLGIIGTNGAGKSTLLKAVSGIMEPTEGYVKREGNIAALLELASGFDGDLTVRENAYLRGAMLGYTRKFMDEKYDEIIEFAELRDFQDRPFKQLSSGMKSRLAFSIASLVAPDILILDEVLSVGDGAFRKKSEAKMQEIIAGGATTILVSHSIQQIRELCTKVLWLDHGRQIALSDDVERICDLYQRFLNKEVKIENVGEILPTDAGKKPIERQKQRKEIPREEEHMKILNEVQKQEIGAETVPQKCIEQKDNPWYEFECIKNISKPFRTAFWSALIMGAITHLYVFTNLLLNHDSVWQLYYRGDAWSLGRWAQPYIRAFSTDFQMPVVIGLISLLMLALSAGLTVRILNITNQVGIILTSGFLVTFPSVACIFSYMFTADTYFVALFFNTFAVYLVKKYKYGWLPGILLLAIACGIYQAFICYAIGLCVFDCALLLISEEEVGNVVRRGVKYIVVLLTSLVAYYAVLKLLQKIRHISLRNYEGISNMSLKNMGKFFMEIPKAYQSYISFFLKSRYLSKGYQLLQTALIVLFLVCCILLALKKRIYREPLRMLFFGVALLTAPLALNFIVVLSIGAEVHMLMVYAFSLQFVFAAKVFELLFQQGGRKWMSFYVTTAILCGMMLWNNFCISNTVYLRMQVCYENSYALANRVVARVESLDGYTPDTPVAIVGEASRKLYGGTVSEFSQFNTLTGTSDALLFSPEPHVRTRTFINQYIGIRMPTPSNEEKSRLRDSEVVKEMPTYPQEGSVAIVDNVIVIKLSEGTIH